MNSILEKEFAPYLLPDENILWQGACQKSDIHTLPIELQVFTSFSNLFKLFGIILFVFFSFIISKIIQFNTKININFIYIMIPLLLVVSAVIYLIKRKATKTNNSVFSSFATIFNPASRGNAIYAMTDKRMLIRTGTTNKELTAIELHTINSIKLIEHNNNLHSITLIGAVARRKSGRMVPKVAGMIQGVENGLELYQLLTARINTTV